MGYAHYELPDGREAGYGVEAECDAASCTTQIDRGLGYLCGQAPDGWRDESEPGCGKYFCGEHTYSHACPNPNGWDEDGKQKLDPEPDPEVLARYGGDLES